MEKNTHDLGYHRPGTGVIRVPAISFFAFDQQNWKLVCLLKLFVSESRLRHPDPAMIRLVYMYLRLWFPGYWCCDSSGRLLQIKQTSLVDLFRLLITIDHYVKLVMNEAGYSL